MVSWDGCGGVFAGPRGLVGFDGLGGLAGLALLAGFVGFDVFALRFAHPFFAAAARARFFFSRVAHPFLAAALRFFRTTSRAFLYSLFLLALALVFLLGEAMARQLARA